MPSISNQFDTSRDRPDSTSYILGEYCHSDGQYGPDDADEAAVAATLYAAHAYLFGCQEFAIWKSSRAVEATDQHLQHPSEQEEDEFSIDMDEALASEVQRRLRDLDLVARCSKDLRRADLGCPSTRLSDSGWSYERPSSAGSWFPRSHQLVPERVAPLPACIDQTV
ncbi:hypothetical protein HY68_35540 [Streptomyces sp. AcH 505]|nr:hypothetical protein HY68_35540 [Streptomyces sp. AcH 505]